MARNRADANISASPRVLVAAPVEQAYGRTAIEAVIAYARRHTDWELLFAPRPTMPGAMQTTGKPIDGVIADGNMPRVDQQVAGFDAPIVLMSGQQHAPNIGSVRINNERVGRLAAEHFVSLGFDHFAFCGMRDVWTSPVRGRAFADALRQLVGPTEVYESITDRGELADWQAEAPELIEWVRSLPKPIAVLCNHDDRARLLSLACQEAGIAVPEQVAILGVNNDELTCEMATPPLSSVDHNARAMGSEAAAMLHRVLRGQPMPDRPVYVEPIGVIARHSTDVLAIEDPVIATAARMIRQRATDGLSVADLLAELPIGRRTLELGFKRALGRTPHQEILRMRLDHAKYLLRDSSMDMPAITSRCGFRYPSQLSAVFRKHIGESPSEYRARHSA